MKPTVKPTAPALLCAALLTACTGMLDSPRHAAAVEQALKQPQPAGQTARLRIYRSKDHYSATQTQNDIQAIRNGRTVTLWPAASYVVMWRADKHDNQLIGIPSSDRFQKSLPFKEIREFEIPAGVPLILGETKAEHCSGAWIFPQCSETTIEYYFIPEANQDYETYGNNHLYLIKDGRSLKLDAQFETIRYREYRK